MILVVLLVLGSGVISGLANDYQQQALEYLAKELQVDKDEISLTGSLLDLPLSGKQLWEGRYQVNGEQVAEDIEDVPDLPMDAPTDKHDSADVRISNASAGMVYLLVETGEILTNEEAWEYINAENMLLEEAVNELRDEAGSIEPYFYWRLNNSAADDLFEVMIWVKFIETPSMQEAMEEVYDTYPEFPKIHFDAAYSQPYRGGGTEGASPPVQDPVTDVDPEASYQDGSSPDDMAVSEPALAPGVTDYPAIEPGDPAGDTVTKDDDIDWDRYREMNEKIAEIRTQGYQENIERLEKELETMGIEYEILDGNAAASCELTVSQLFQLKDKDYIQSINEQGSYYALSFALESENAALARDDAAPPANGERADLDSGVKESSSLPWLAISASSTAILLAGLGGFMIYRKKKS